MSHLRRTIKSSQHEVQLSFHHRFNIAERVKISPVVHASSICWNSVLWYLLYRSCAATVNIFIVYIILLRSDMLGDNWRVSCYIMKMQGYHDSKLSNFQVSFRSACFNPLCGLTIVMEAKKPMISVSAKQLIYQEGQVALTPMVTWNRHETHQSQGAQSSFSLLYH